MSLDPRIASLTERVKRLEATVEALREGLRNHCLVANPELKSLRNTVEVLSAIVYHREPPKVEVTVENVLDGLSAELKELVEVGEFEGEVRVCMKQYIPDRSKWNTINKFLRQKGLPWNSLKKDSYWGTR